MPALRPDGLTAYLRTYGDSQPPTGTVIRCGRCGVSQHPDEFYIGSCIKLIARGGRPTGPYTRCRTRHHRQGEGGRLHRLRPCKPPP